jgi:hypothetical protein
MPAVSTEPANVDCLSAARMAAGMTSRARRLSSPAEVG